MSRPGRVDLVEQRPEDSGAEPAAEQVAGTAGLVLASRAGLSLLALHPRGAALGGMRGVGNAQLARAVAALMRRKVIPDKEQSPEQKAFVIQQVGKQKEEAKAIAGNFAAKAQDDLEKAHTHFAAEKMAEHGPVDPEMTPLTAEQVAAAYGVAWQSVFGQPIPAQALAMLIGKWKTEGGEKGIANYNIGNIQVPGAPGHTADKNAPPTGMPSDVAWRGADEFDPTKGQRSKKQAWYAAYKSAEEGALGVIRYLTTEKRNGAMFGALVHGTPREYAFCAYNAGYFNAAPEDIVWPATGDVLQSGYGNTIMATLPKGKTLDALVAGAHEAGASAAGAQPEQASPAPPDAGPSSPAGEAAPPPEAAPEPAPGGGGSPRGGGGTGGAGPGGSGAEGGPPS
jgi:hypothetical protein